MKSQKGQVLVAVLILMTVLAILVPVMVTFVQNEAKWTAKQGQTTTAFHQAEAGTEKALLTMTLSTQTWVAIQNCQFGGANPCSPTDFQWDRAFTDVAGGEYSIYITSGPSSQQATVLSIGRDAKKKETRSLKVIYSNAPLGNVAIYAGNGIIINGGVTVEWGAIISPVQIDFGATMPTYPQAYSAGAIKPVSTTPLSNLCDTNCWQWHSYYANIPPSPVIDLNFYKASATATSTYYPNAAEPGACSGGVCTWQNMTAAASTYNHDGITTYVAGDLYIGNSNPKMDYVGTVIVMGNFSTFNGAWGNGCPGHCAAGRCNPPMYLPQTAWQQYGNNWAHYNFGDATKPAVFPTLQSTYLSPANTTYNNCSPDKTALEGMMYVQGGFNTGGGGGNTDIYGNLYVIGSSSATSNSGVTIYYDNQTGNNLQTTQISLSRTWWQDVVLKWPAALP